MKKLGRRVGPLAAILTVVAVLGVVAALLLNNSPVVIHQTITVGEMTITMTTESGSDNYNAPDGMIGEPVHYILNAKISGDGLLSDPSFQIIIEKSDIHKADISRMYFYGGSGNSGWEIDVDTSRPSEESGSTLVYDAPFPDNPTMSPGLDLTVHFDITYEAIGDYTVTAWLLGTAV